MVTNTAESKRSLSQEKEIFVTALLSLQDLLGWSEKTVMFSGKTLADFLRMFSTKEGDNLYEMLVDQDGSIRLEYTVRLNNRPVKQPLSQRVFLESGDRVVLMPVMKFAAGG